MPFVQSQLVRRIIGAAIAVHRSLGPGLFESSYEACLSHELTERRISFVQQVHVPVVYKGVRLSCGYRADMLVENEILLEFKCLEKWLPIHRSQMITYLKLLGLRQGLLINFNVPRLIDGVKSVLVEPVTFERTEEAEVELFSYRPS
jgi:GxxExxY protein